MSEEQRLEQTEAAAETPAGAVDLTGDELDQVNGGLAASATKAPRPAGTGDQQGIIAVLIGL
jgi:hypothetical protein